jgi:hypothetical protein
VRCIVTGGAGFIGTQYAIDAGWSVKDVTYVDINRANQGLVLSATGHPVHSLNALRERPVDAVMIASGWEEDVRKQLQPHVKAGTLVLAFDDLLAP